jgi:hypothetical protein
MDMWIRKHMLDVQDTCKDLSSDHKIDLKQCEMFLQVKMLAKEASRQPNNFVINKANAAVKALCTACRSTWEAYDPECNQRHQWFQPCALVSNYRASLEN